MRAPFWLHDLVKRALWLSWLLGASACSGSSSPPRSLPTAGVEQPRVPAIMQPATPSVSREASAKGAHEVTALPEAEASKAGPILVELFTSEGCSSCPPAEALVHRLWQESGTPTWRLLAFHVDYWNDLGWPDPWSSTAATLRQQAYSRARSEKGVYTPQLVVNGGESFVGSDEDRARQELQRARASSSAVHLEGSARWNDSRELSIALTLSHAAPGATLAVVLTEDGLLSHITAGENAGKTLLHEGVVRSIQTTQLTDALGATLTLSVPLPVARGSTHLIAFVQQASMGAILGSVELPLPMGP